jgi:hypothetical protein
MVYCVIRQQSPSSISANRDEIDRIVRKDAVKSWGYSGETLHCSARGVGGVRSGYDIRVTGCNSHASHSEAATEEGTAKRHRRRHGEAAQKKAQRSGYRGNLQEAAGEVCRLPD